MVSFLLAFVAAAATGLAGSVAVRVARLSAALGGSALVLLASLLACITVCCVAALLGARLSAQLDLQVRAAFVSIVPLIAALDLALQRVARVPLEPTRSFGAIFLVLVVSQFLSAVSLAILAVSAASGQPWLAAIGGMFGAGAVLALAWKWGGVFEKRLPLLKIRCGVIAVLCGVGLVIGLSGQGFIR